jgi:hypothetical protein
MTVSTDAPVCVNCGVPVDPTGPAVALAGANGCTGPVFVAFVAEAPTLGTGGVVHLTCYIHAHGDRALAELLHAPKQRAMDRH